MGLDDLHALPALKIWDGVAARALDGERITFSVVELDPNAVVPEHAHENEQLGMVLSGSVVFRIAEESRELRAGGTWCIPANVPHEVRVGPDGAVVIDVFSPPRADWRELERLPERAPRWPDR